MSKRKRHEYGGSDAFLARQRVTLSPDAVLALCDLIEARERAVQPSHDPATYAVPATFDQIVNNLIIQAGKRHARQGAQWKRQSQSQQGMRGQQGR